MTTWAPPIEKVTMLITRPGPNGPELVVFDHPRGDVQLPAGTVEPGEAFVDAAVREAWEETGALGLVLAGEVAALPWTFPPERGALADSVAIGDRRIGRGWYADVHLVDGDEVELESNGVRGRVPTRLVARGEERRVFHLRCTVEMPDQWWVVTPDGDGLTWRCRWVSLDAAQEQLGAWHTIWLDAARPEIDTAPDTPPRPRPPLPAGFEGLRAWETFLAPPRGAKRIVVGIAEQEDPERCTRAHGLCVTDDGSVVLIQDADGRWDLPGGGKEGAESTAETFAREVAEEACARVLGALFVTAHRIVELDGRGSPTGQVGMHAWMWARVELDAWEPRFETTARRLVTPDEAVAVTVFPYQTEYLLDRAALIDPALDWKPSSVEDR